HMDFVAPANLLDWEAQATGFDDMAAYHWGTEEQILLAAGEPRRVRVLRVTAELFTVLGVRPLHGATFRPAETWQGSELSVVLSHGLWQRHFGADPAVVGRTIRVHGESRTVRGVMPPGFAFPDAGVDLWVPYGWDPEVRLAVEFRRHHYLRAVARLRPGVRAAEAAAELAAIARRLEAAHPLTNETMGAGLTPLHDWVVGETRTPLLVLSGAVIMVLAVACANVVNLLWVRFGARVREMAVRSVLGARRSRLVGQLLSECLLLALGAGALGLLLGHWGLRLLLVLSPQELPRLGEVGVDLRGVGFSLAVVLAATVACGLAPALSGSRLELQPALREGARGPAAGRGQRRPRDLLAVAEVAVALVLVLGSGLLPRSFR
ncbi:MAG: FtsX-like permease family protein, partial [bacterium]|nr:FtsX-like permease family protein [bacterium]